MEKKIEKQNSLIYLFEVESWKCAFGPFMTVCLHFFNTFTQILSIIGDNALSCEFVLYNIDATSEYNSDNISASVTMGCAKIVFLNLFMSSVLVSYNRLKVLYQFFFRFMQFLYLFYQQDFLGNFQTAQQKIKDAGVAAAEAAKTNVVEAYSQATRMKLNIKIKAPIFIIPIDSQTFEAIAIDLGFLSVTNKCVDIHSKVT